MPSLSRVARSVTCYFTPEEFLHLNPGKYHSVEHVVRVARLVAELARAFGRDPEEVRFLEQVALIHDADERIDADTGQRVPLRPARVSVTLEWLQRNRVLIEERFGWNRQRFREAMALVVRTDYPFNEDPRFHGTCYDGQDPYELYRDLLLELSPPDRVRVMENALLLVFADQTANYTGTFREALKFQQGLVEELRTIGVEADRRSLDTPGFLRAVGRDLSRDLKLASELAVEPRLPPRDRVMQCMPYELRRNLEMNEEHFRRITGCPKD